MQELSKRQKEIVEISTKIISEKGIQHLTIKNIAKELNFSEPAVYRHFKSKMDILVAIIDQFKTYNEYISKELNSSMDTTINKIKFLYSSTFKQFKNNPSLTSVLFSEEIFQHEEQLSKIVVNIMETNQKILKKLIQEGQNLKEIRADINKNQLAIILMGSLRLLVTRWKLKKYQFDLTKEGNELVRNIITMLK